MKEQKNTDSQIDQNSFLSGSSAHYIEKLYAQYEHNPSSVDKQWRDYFDSLNEDKDIVLKNVKGASWQKENWPITPNSTMIAALDGDWTSVEKLLEKKIQQNTSNPRNDLEIFKATQLSLKTLKLIDAYMCYGHLKADIDPLGLKNNRGCYHQLALGNFGLSEQDLQKEIFIDGALGLEKATLQQILYLLNQKYCSTIGAEFMHISDPVQRNWFKDKFENFNRSNEFTPQQQKEIFLKLVEAEGFEQFLDAKYKGAKRFGLDGGESLIPALSELLKLSSRQGVKEIVIGMAHRGRLNVLANILGKEHKALFHEFKGGSYKPDNVAGSGDVKYHLGASKDYDYNGKKLHVSLLPNPSHLEIVDPVVLGKARAKQDNLIAQEGEKTNIDDAMLSKRIAVLPVLLHGDAAFAGQGIVQEILAASGLKGYTVSGSLHIIINNQIGFTTDPEFSRSTVYATDVGKMLESPILHVNGDDTEAVIFALSLAFTYRQEFKKPVIVDMYCYRRLGHNEGDEPFFTQPIMYKTIKTHSKVTQIYGDKLVNSKIIDREYVDKTKADWRGYLESEFLEADNFEPEADWLQGNWRGLKALQFADRELGLSTVVKTGVELNTLKQIGEKLISIPENFALHKTIQRFLDSRAKMLETEQNIDWAMAEALAFGSLLLENHPIRFSGEDVERGTFSQRHSVVYDQETKEKYVALNNLMDNQKVYYEPINSLLSEEGVLGYEYGYSLVQPNGLVLWEAQFGDFANGAQVVFDQFISSAETKWLRMSGLVCLLPHGYEGQGPEHSSARLERFLQLCAEDNMQVAYCTTPANYFHILRRQLKRNFRKPLILMTPKSLLRHKRAQSALQDMAANTGFNRILLDDAQKASSLIKLQKDAQIKRVVLCSGKVYYDLYEEREKRAIDNVYLLRVEQLYPYPAKELVNELSRFSEAEIIWCQEEPQNMGAWSYIEPQLETTLGYINAKYKRAKYIGRSAASSPAVGLLSEHLLQLHNFLEDVFG